MAERVSISDRLVNARRRIDRYEPREAFAAFEGGAVMVDTRCSDDLRSEGRIPGAMEIPLSVLEWRLDPSSALADESLTDLNRPIILVCNDGFSSSLAAASLVELGFAYVGDVIGGFRAWAVAGLPIAS